MTKILIVDDNEQNLYMLSVLLQGSGYQVETAANGEEALSKARAEHPDIIISDILMPVIDGFTLCREWKKDEALKTIPFVFYTATYTDPGDEEFALSLGAERFIRKPVEVEVFIGILREVIEQYKAGQLVAKREAVAEEAVYFKLYNETLIRKLESKIERLEEANKALKEEITKRKQTEEALQFTRFSVDNAADTMVWVDHDARFIDINDAFCRSMGYSREELLSMTVHDIDPDYSAEIWPEFWEKLKQSGSLTFESCHRSKEGRIVPVEITANYFEYNGKEYHCSFARDITERKRTEEALRESEANLNRAQTVAHVGSWYWEVPEDVLKWSAETYRMFGVAEGTPVTSGDFMALVHPEDRDYIDRSWQAALAGAAYDIENRIVVKGEVKWVHQLADLEFDSKGNIKAGIGTVQDITERKRTEEALQIEGNKLDAVTQHIGGGLALISKDYRTLWANETLKQIFGNVEGKICYSTYNQRTEICPGCGVKEIFQKRSNRVVHEQVGKDIEGNTIWSEIITTPIKDSGGNITAALELVIPITERKRAGEELKNSRQQLRDLASHLQSVREEERKSIAREIHDELGQALTALKMDLSWLRKKLTKNEKPLVEKTESMSKLIDATAQTMKRISTELRPGLLDDLGITAAIEWQAEEFQNRTGIKCNVNVKPEEIILDEKLSTAIFRVFQETLVNVARHANATRVKASLVEKVDKLELKVRDNGKGIAAKQISNPKSFGLIGMRERVHPWGGEFKIEGKPREGTTVTVTIPLNRK